MRYFDHQTVVRNAGDTVTVVQHHLIAGYARNHVGAVALKRSTGLDKGALYFALPGEGVGAVTVLRDQGVWVLELTHAAERTIVVRAGTSKREAAIYAAELVGHLTTGRLAPIDAVLALLAGSAVLRRENPEKAANLQARKDERALAAAAAQAPAAPVEAPVENGAATITIPASALPARGHVARGLLEGGHRPGVLSLAGLAGKARQFAGTYVRARDEAIRIAAAYGVHDGTTLIGSRHCRVWQRGGQPVRIQIGEA